MSSAEDLLIEIGTEELPPCSIKTLALSFKEEIAAEFVRQRLSYKGITWYATPRRLALIVTALASRQQDRHYQRRGPSLKAAYTQDKKPTPAALGFAKSCAVHIDQLEHLETKHGVWLAYHGLEKGQAVAALLPAIVTQALKKLPILKRMRWGKNQLEFIRPVHWLVLLFGRTVIDCNLFGLRADRYTYGHRFHHPAPISLDHAAEYPEKLQKIGFVRADFQDRLEHIKCEIKQIAAQKKGVALIDCDLLEELAGLTEWPVALAGSFDASFLTLPKAVLIAVMRDQQKYIPITRDNKLLPIFIVISNVVSTKPERIIRGNERVIRPRLRDALFFYQRDRTAPLSSRIDALRNVVYQKELGSLYDKSQRIEALVTNMAQILGSTLAPVVRAAALSKCDLLTSMVNEFPKLQGTIGRYYAVHDGESDTVAIAIDEQYMPRFSGDRLPQTEAGQILAIADKVDTLAGSFVLGQIPDGDKDPFGLRRAALGVLRIMIECDLDINLLSLLEKAVAQFDDASNARTIIADLFSFIMERLRYYYLNHKVTSDVFEAVLAVRPNSPLDFHRRIHAVKQFHLLPESASLAAANKRICNILKKTTLEKADLIDSTLLQEPAEIQLAKQVDICRARITPLLKDADYKAVLSELAKLNDSVDAFFLHVMVMCENEQQKKNRLILLWQLNRLFMEAADISKLKN